MECALTTVDNPYDPFKQFTQWWLFDIEKGYNTCEHLGRLINVPENATQNEEDLLVEEAIDRIIKNDVLNIYKKIKQKK